ncbi:MAG TPA: PAS domain S-box protein, partial [Candidatus Obscuribacterales bacterium]
MFGILKQFVLKPLKISRQKSELIKSQETIETYHSLLCATLDATADGILVVDRQGRIVSFNKTLVDMWSIPESILQSRDDKQRQLLAKAQLKDPIGFEERLRELFNQPDSESYDLLELKDGRVFERYSRPQRLDGQIVGRVFSFRDITERKQATEALHKAHAQLEIRVEERTAQLQDANEQLLKEIVERRRVENKLLERSRLAALNADIGLALTQNDSLVDMLQQCAKALVRHLNAAFARIWTLKPEENVLELQASAGMYTHINGSHSRITIGECKIGAIAQNRQPHISNTFQSDPRVHD